MQLSREELLKAHRDMATIRRFDERVQDEFSKAAFPVLSISNQLKPDRR